MILPWWQFLSLYHSSFGWGWGEKMYTPNFSCSSGFLCSLIDSELINAKPVVYIHSINRRHHHLHSICTYQYFASWWCRNRKLEIVFSFSKKGRKILSRAHAFISQPRYNLYWPNPVLQSVLDNDLRRAGNVERASTVQYIWAVCDWLYNNDDLLNNKKRDKESDDGEKAGAVLSEPFRVRPTVVFCASSP